MGDREALWVMGHGPRKIHSSVKAMRMLEKFTKINLFRTLYIKQSLATTQEIFLFRKNG